MKVRYEGSLPQTVNVMELFMELELFLSAYFHEGYA